MPACSDSFEFGFSPDSSVLLVWVLGREESNCNEAVSCVYSPVSLGAWTGGLELDDL